MRYGVNGDKTIPYNKHIAKISTKRGHSTAMKNELKLIASHGELLPPPLSPLYENIKVTTIQYPTKTTSDTCS
jgi:hypothetical protein